MLRDKETATTGGNKVGPISRAISTDAPIPLYDVQGGLCFRYFWGVLSIALPVSYNL
jgi:hypothetical protein